jgi:DNA-binding XRE family transcriptional regulator
VAAYRLFEDGGKRSDKSDVKHLNYSRGADAETLGASATPFGRLLKEWRKRRGHSQLDLAVAVLTTQRQVSFIESGRAAPSRDMILRFVGGDGYSVAGGGRPWFVRYA